MRVEEIQILAAEVLAPPPDLTVSQWADQNRRLSSESAAEKGEWRTDRAPYQRAVMDSMGPNSTFETVVLMWAAQSGKCLALDTPLPTPDGWEAISNIEPGDRLFDDRGNVCRVLATSDVKHGLACYRVRFDDGNEITTDAEHLWFAHDRRQNKFCEVTTEEMSREVPIKRDRQEAFRYRISCAEPLSLPDVVLPIDPYVLGVWLGDGSSHHAQITGLLSDGIDQLLAATGTEARVIRTTSSGVPTVQVGRAKRIALRSECPRGHRLEGNNVGPGYCRPCKVMHAIATKRRKQERLGQERLFPRVAGRTNTLETSDTMTAQLHRLGVLHNKHIPSAYLRASESQRRALLQGLLDTDGYASSTGSAVEFTNTNERLAKEFCELSVSLGFKPSFKKGRATLRGKDCGPKFRIHFTAYREDLPFRLERKLNRLRTADAPRSRPTESRRRSIIAIEPVDSVPVRCLAVDSPSRLFLAGKGMIPTHNSSLIENYLGYIIELDPGPVLLVQPREVDAEAFSKDRLAPMLRDTPSLGGRVADSRSRDSNNTILHKKFLGGSITLAAANSPAGLAMRSIRYCLLDEVDRYPASAGSEGDPVNLAITRTANFWNRKVVMCSTPTTKGASRIEHAWLNSNQQSYWVPCPHCSGFQVLRWENLVWPKTEPEQARYRCEHCAREIEDWQKHQMLKAGEWRAARPDVSDVAGFWINGLYSPWRKWGALAKKFLVDKQSIETLREFVNTVLAEPWDDAAETAVDQAAVMARREHYRAAVPFGAVVLTVGVDVQKDRLEMELVGWGRGEESWSIEYRVLPGDPSGALVWQELDTYLERRWPHETGISLPVAACAIDSGYESQAVYEFCRTRYHRRIFAVKGKGGTLPVWQRKPTSKNIRGEKPWIVGTDTAKETVYGRLKNPTLGTPGYSHFPSDRTETYFEQLLGEVLVTTYAKGQPKREWRPKPGVRQEALDARVYAYAGLRALVSMGLSLDNEADRILATARPQSVPDGDPDRARWLGDRRKNWLSR
ncbi:MAG: terminase gpA endonuclease subunit [Bryobacteraceae bacterium]